MARALRGATWTLMGYGAAQVLRLVSNIVMARLLFPEAFGLMALVIVIITGLAMFSDLGLGPAILRSPRGDDPAFLDTGWTAQVLRGAVLWVACIALAWPAAAFYGEPMLAALLPVAGVSLLLAGFNPTRIETANRHLLLGRVTVLDLAAQAISLVVMMPVALMTGSIWALVVGMIASALAKLVLMHFLLPGPANRFRWESAAASELFQFGKWIFLSTICGFLLSQGDRAILGHYLTMEQLGLYNIAFFITSFPIVLGNTLVTRMLLPLYRERPPGASAANFARLRQMRCALTGMVLALLLMLAFGGVALVDLLYDARYSTAGGLVVALACVLIPQSIGMTYSQIALAAGDSRSFFMLLALQATVLILFFLIGAELGGVAGALLGQALALALLHLPTIWLARRFDGWDPLHDAAFAAAGLSLGGLALWVNRDAVALLATF